ncbi:MAG TPA: Sec-independent protein translocase protein TatB [Rhodanobacter sp.]|nr:Sec-independent protein translocase protein TatB [Rhodanobacter sp.]
MIEFSLGKLVLLALIALIVLGPEKLPGAARTAGALLRRVRNGWDEVRAEVERELEVEEIRRAAREAVAHVEAAQQEVKDGLNQVHKPVAELVGEVTATDAPMDQHVTEAANPDEPPEAGRQAELPLGEPASGEPTLGEPALGEPALGEPASPIRNAAHDRA